MSQHCSGIDDVKSKKAEQQKRKRDREKYSFDQIAVLMKVPKNTSRVDILNKTVIQLNKMKCALDGVALGLPFEDIIRPRLDFPEDIFTNEEFYDDQKILSYFFE